VGRDAGQGAAKPSAAFVPSIEVGVLGVRPGQQSKVSRVVAAPGEKRALTMERLSRCDTLASGWSSRPGERDGQRFPQCNAGARCVK